MHCFMAVQVTSLEQQNGMSQKAKVVHPAQGA
jgi:hypothetical protein